MYFIIRACGRNIVVVSQDWADFGAGNVAVLGVLNEWLTMTGQGHELG